MKRAMIVAVLIIIYLIGAATYAFASDDKQYSPNDIYIFLYSVLGKDTMAQPASQLVFGENPAAMIEKIIQKELAIKSTKIARGKLFNYRYTQVYYDNCWMVYYTGNGVVPGWDDKLFEIAFTRTYKNQQLNEKETNIFSKLNQLYGEYTRVSKYMIEQRELFSDFDDIQFDPKLNYYIWEGNNLIVTYRCTYYKKDSNIVIEFWDKNYFKQNEVNGKFQVLQY